IEKGAVPKAGPRVERSAKRVNCERNHVRSRHDSRFRARSVSAGAVCDGFLPRRSSKAADSPVLGSYRLAPRWAAARVNAPADRWPIGSQLVLKKFRPANSNYMTMKAVS